MNKTGSRQQRSPLVDRPSGAAHISPLQFVRTFQRVFALNRPEVDHHISSKAAWTDFMVGSGSGSFGLLGEMGKSFGYKLEREQYDIDQIWLYRAPKRFLRRKTLQRTHKIVVGPFRWLFVLIEHELGIARWSKSLDKMFPLNAPLKVLITYPPRPHMGTYYSGKTVLRSAEQFLHVRESRNCGTYLIGFGPAWPPGRTIEEREWRWHKWTKRGFRRVGATS